MKANRIQIFWIILRSLFVTLKVSTLVLIAGIFKGSTRKRIDHLAFLWSRAVLRIIRLKYTVHNPHQVKFEPNRPYVIMSNHASHYDIPLIYMAFPHASIRMIAKKELFRFPIWGHAMKAGGFIDIDRKNPRQAIKDVKRAKLKMEEGIVLWMAPEGTRTRTGKMQTFKKGGFRIAEQMKATIIPVGICGSYRVLPPDTWQFRLRESVEINIGKPIDVTQYSAKERKQLLLDVETTIQDLAGETSNHLAADSS